VQVADLDVQLDDRLAVELRQELHGPVGHRVGRTHVQDLVIGVQVALALARVLLERRDHG
jgi:hypothetical protein